MDEFFAIIARADVSSLAKLLSSGQNVNITDRMGRTGLMYAALEGNIELIKLFIAHRSELDVQDKGGYTALHFAAQDFRPEAVELLCKSGAMIDLVDKYGNTPLGRAVMNSKGRGEVIKILLHYGADRNKKNNYKSSPWDAANLIANYDIKQFFN